MQQIPFIDLAADIVAEGRQQYRCIVPNSVYTIKKCSWRWASLSPETCRVDLKRSINGIYCVLLVAYIVVLLMMHGRTNINFTRTLWLTNFIIKILILLTPRCKILLEHLTGLQLVKKFPAFHGTRRFFTALTSVRHLSLSWANPIQSINPHPTSWRSILILSIHLRLGLPSCSSKHNLF